MNITPWGERISPDKIPIGFDKKYGDIVKWRNPEPGPLYDKTAMDDATEACKAKDDEIARMKEYITRIREYQKDGDWQMMGISIREAYDECVTHEAEAL